MPSRPVDQKWSCNEQKYRGAETEDDSSIVVLFRRFRCLHIAACGPRDICDVTNGSICRYLLNVLER